MSIKWIERSMVVSPYSIGLCKKEKHFHRELKRLKVPKRQWPVWVTPGKDASVHYLEKTSYRPLCCIVCIQVGHKDTKSQVIGLLVHEAVHIFDAIVNDLNEREPGREFKAYTIQNIAQRLIEAYK